MKHLFRLLLSLPLLLTALTACVQADDLPSTPRGDFEALWKIIDEHYCFFDYKHKEYGLDWNEVHRRYAPQVSDSMSSQALYQVLANLCDELRDGHVNLWTPFNTARYTNWYEAYPTDFDDSLQRVVLGTADEYRTASGLQYKVLPGNVGYIRCSSFNVAIGAGNLHEVMLAFSPSATPSSSMCAATAAANSPRPRRWLRSSPIARSRWATSCTKRAPHTTRSPHRNPCASVPSRGCGGRNLWRCSSTAVPSVPPIPLPCT